MLTAQGLSVSAAGLFADKALSAERAEESEVATNHTPVIDPTKCTGCLACAMACADKFMQEIAPEAAQDTINLEFSRIRPMRFQFVDFVDVCQTVS